MKKAHRAIIGAAFLLGACNTMEGFGQDVEQPATRSRTEAAGTTSDANATSASSSAGTTQRPWRSSTPSGTSPTRRGAGALARLRAWMIHALAEEPRLSRARGCIHASRTSVRRARAGGGPVREARAARRGTLEWQRASRRGAGDARRLARCDARIIEAEEGTRSSSRWSEQSRRRELVELGSSFVLARDKLTMLEEAQRPPRAPTGVGPQPRALHQRAQLRRIERPERAERAPAVACKRERAEGLRRARDRHAARMSERLHAQRRASRRSRARARSAAAGSAQRSRARIDARRRARGSPAAAISPRQRRERLGRARERAQRVEADHVGAALPDAVQRRLAVEARERALLDVAVAAEALHRLGGDRASCACTASTWRSA